MTERCVLGLEEVDKTQVALVGGKGAHLGELSRIEGILRAGWLLRDDGRLPPGNAGNERRPVCRRSARSAVAPGARRLGGVRTLSAEIRRAIVGTAIPDGLAAAITRELARLGERAGYAVRSSATAKSSPGQS